MNNKALILDLVQWLSEGPKAYSDVMRAWRTSCPRLSIWEDAVDFGLVQVESRAGDGLVVTITAAGAGLLAAERQPVASLRA